MSQVVEGQSRWRFCCGQSLARSLGGRSPAVGRAGPRWRASSRPRGVTPGCRRQRSGAGRPGSTPERHRGRGASWRKRRRRQRVHAVSVMRQALFTLRERNLTDLQQLDPVKLHDAQWRFHAGARGRGHRPLQIVARPPNLAVLITHCG